MDSIYPTKKALKTVIQKSFRSVGIEIRGVQPTPPKAELPPIFQDPLEALHHAIGMRDAAFHCPIDQCVSPHGFGFSNQSWHPLSDTLTELRNGNCTQYEGPVLERFFHRWQPRNLREAIPCLPQAPEHFSQLPSYLLLLHPWVSLSPQQILADIRLWCRLDYREHGRPEFGFDTHGFHYHGPVHPALGELEFSRLQTIYRSIKQFGFDREHGDIQVWLLKRDNELRYLRMGVGTHRMAAIQALGHETFPAQLLRPKVIDINDVDYWPQVRAGIWDRTSAQHYFNSLFDFDALSWARSLSIHR